MNLEEKIFQLIEKYNYFNFEISTNTILTDDLSIDSFSFISLINDIEKEFNIKFKSNEFKKCDQVKELIMLVGVKIFENNNTK